MIKDLVTTGSDTRLYQALETMEVKRIRRRLPLR